MVNLYALKSALGVVNRVIVSKLIIPTIPSYIKSSGFVLPVIVENIQLDENARCDYHTNKRKSLDKIRIV